MNGRYARSRMREFPLSLPLSLSLLTFRPTQRIGQRTVTKEEKRRAVEGVWINTSGSGHTLMLVMKPWPRERDRHEDPAAP